MRKLTHTLFLVTLLSSVNAYAGTANINLQCQAKTTGQSPLLLEAQLPGDYDEFELQLKQADRRLNWSMDESELKIEVAMRKKKFSFEILHKNGEQIALRALPASLKSKGNNSRLFEASFEAEFSYKAPKKDTPWPVSGAMTCKASHHI